MSNGDKPAAPIKGTHGHIYLGLTKREAFAKDAPDPPDWFMAEKKHHANEAFDEGAAWFEWRTFYADALLKALEES